MALSSCCKRLNVCVCKCVCVCVCVVVVSWGDNHSVVVSCVVVVEYTGV